MKQFDFTYVKVNSLYRNRIQDGSNILDFSILDNGQSGVNNIGIGRTPTDVIQLEIGNVYIPKKIEELVFMTADSLIFNRMYILVNQFDSEYFSSPQGFKYHFELLVEQDQQDDTQLIAKPVNPRFTFANPIRFFSRLTFSFYTYKPYIFEQNIIEVYADYTTPFLRFRKIDGSDHLLTGYDLISIQNFDVPGALSQDSRNASTYRDNYYRINPISSTIFEIPIVLEQSIATSINRPGDQALGYYRPPISCTSVASISPTIITTPIPHGFLDGDIITITSVSDLNLQTIVRQFQVTVVAPNILSIPFDSSAVIGQFSVVVQAFTRISPSRQNSLFLYIQTKRVEFQLQIKSLSQTANNGIITIS